MIEYDADVALDGLVEGGELRGPGGRGRRTAEDLFRQRLRRDHAVGGEQHRALDHVRELADVAGPRVLQQAPQGILREAGRRLAGLLTVFPEEMLEQNRDVVAPLAERREGDRDHGQAVVEIL